MRRFTIKLLLFLLPVIALVVYTEIRLSTLHNSYNKKRQLLEQQANEIEVLVLGSSQALYGIDPSYFCCKGYNVANVHQTIYYDKRILLNYLPKLTKLKAVIISVSYPSFMGQLRNSKEAWRDYFYYRFWGIRYKNLSRFNSKRFSFIELYGMNETLKYLEKGFKIDLSADIQTCGYARNDSIHHLQKISDSLGKLRVAYHNSTYNAKEVNYIINDLDDMIAALKQRGISTILISPPVYHTYSDKCNKEYVTLVEDVTKKMSAKYGCKVYNYFTDARFTIDDFADNDHLSYVGAAKFSKIIDSEVIRPIYKAK